MVQLHKTKNLVEHMIKHSVLNIENIGKSTFIPLHDQSREEIDIGNKTNENTRVYFLHKEEQQLRKRTSHFATSYYFSVKIDTKLKGKNFLLIRSKFWELLLLIERVFDLVLNILCLNLCLMIVCLHLLLSLFLNFQL